MKYLEHPYWSGYRASKNGSVKGKRGIELNPIKHHTGYLVITVRKDKIQKQLRVHRFIWECHHGIIENTDLVINHIDGNKHNNSLDNLELVTQQDNCNHAFDTGLRSGMKGKGNGMSKLTEDDAALLINDVVAGLSNKVIGDKYGLHPNYVSLIRHKRRWGWLWTKLNK